jgi:hypothetical protein
VQAVQNIKGKRMASKIDIFNMALGHIGVSSTVADELERSPERVICTRYWDTCRDALLSYKSMDWGFATSAVVLADIGTPPTGWGFRYRYPNDCIEAQEIMGSSGRTEPVELRPKFDVQYEADGRVILADTQEAVLRYTKRVEEVERWPSYFVEAMAYRLASLIVMPLKNDASNRNNLLQLAEQFAQIAMAASLNEGQPDGPLPSIYEAEIHA